MLLACGARGPHVALKQRISDGMSSTVQQVSILMAGGMLCEYAAIKGWMVPKKGILRLTASREGNHVEHQERSDEIAKILDKTCS